MVCLFLKSVLLMMLRSVSLSMNDVRMNLLIGYQIHILIIVWGQLLRDASDIGLYVDYQYDEVTGLLKSSTDHKGRQRK